MVNKELDKYKFTVENIDILQESDVHALVKIRVMHDGLNKNNTRHSLESIRNALPSIYNIPIGIKYNVFKDDATEHIKDGENETVQHNVGTIPQTNRVTFVEEDGKMHLEVFGVIWKEDCKYAYELLKKGSLKQSMEEFVYQSEILPDGTMNIEKFKFTRLQLLSNAVTPAMETAKVALQYTVEEQDKVKSSNSFLEKILNDIETDEIIQGEEKVLKEKGKNEVEQNEIATENLEANELELVDNEAIEQEEVVEAKEEMEAKTDETCVEEEAEEEVEKEASEQEEDISEKYSALLATHAQQTIELDTLRSENDGLKKTNKELSEYKIKSEADAKKAEFESFVDQHIEKYAKFLNDGDKEYIKELANSEGQTLEQIKNTIYEKVISNSKISEGVKDEKKLDFKTYSFVGNVKSKTQSTPKNDFEKLVSFNNKEKESEIK